MAQARTVVKFRFWRIGARFLRSAKSNIGMPLRTLQFDIEPTMRLTLLCVALLVAG